MQKENKEITEPSVPWPNKFFDDYNSNFCHSNFFTIIIEETLFSLFPILPYRRVRRIVLFETVAKSYDLGLGTKNRYNLSDQCFDCQTVQTKKRV